METDSHSFIHSDSSQNPKYVTSILSAGSLCLRRNCNDNEDFLTKANEMFLLFQLQLIQCPMSNRPQWNLYSFRTKASQPRPKENTNERTPLVLTYHPLVHQIKRILL